MKKKDPPVDGPKGPFNNPFGSLGALKAALPEGPPAPHAGKVPLPPRKQGPVRAVVRLERKGRGGKEVTVVEHLGLGAKELPVWLKALKAALGCGGVIEEDTLVLQGDQRERLPELLTGRGVARVTLG